MMLCLVLRETASGVIQRRIKLAERVGLAFGEMLMTGAQSVMTGLENGD